MIINGIRNILSLLKQRNDKRKAFKKLKRNSKDIEINMDNVISSIHGSKELYKSLSKKYHPDKIMDSEIKKIIEPLFTEITANKNDVNKMKEIEIRIKSLID